jgi:hypothetical protein
MPAGQDQSDKTAPAAQDEGHEPPPKTGVHRTFAALAGDYDVAIKFTPPEGEAMTSKGTARLTSILDGRFLLEEHEGEMMGEKIKGMRLYGWNAEAKVFEGTWVYTQSNAMMRLSGRAGADRSSVEFEAVADGKEKMKLQIKVQRNQDGSLVTTLMHPGPDGKATATLEETYTKKK